jgi:hypothetical protein
VHREKETVAAQALTAVVDASTTQQKEITIATSPNAKCILRSSVSPNTQSMPVWADDVGLVHLWAAPKSASEGYSLECNESRTVVQHAFDLAAAATFVHATPRATAAGRTVRPALANPLSIAQADLVKAGYPPRPDPTLAPTLYKKWLETVSVTAIQVPPNLVERSDLHFQAGNGSAWCGLFLQNFTNHYSLAVGTFAVPPFVPIASQSNAAIWPGVGGGEVIQDGVDYQSLGSVGHYNAWYEYTGPSSNAVFNTAMVIRPADSMDFWAWEGNSSCTMVAGGGYGCFWYQNQTPNPPTSFGTLGVQAPDNSFNGQTALAMMERQSGVALSPWYFAEMALIGVDSVGYEHFFATDVYWNATLVNASGQVMCSPQYGGYPNYVSYLWQSAQ